MRKAGRANARDPFAPTHFAQSHQRSNLLPRAFGWIGNTYLDDFGRDSPASLNSTGDM